MTIVLTRRERYREEEYHEKRGTFKRRKKMVTDTGIMLPQAKECLGLPVVGKARKDPLFEVQREHDLPIDF